MIITEEEVVLLHKRLEDLAGKLAAQRNQYRKAGDELAAAGSMLDEAISNTDVYFCKQTIANWQAALRRWREVTGTARPPTAGV